MIQNSIDTVLIIFILIGIGIFVSHKKWVDRATARAFPRLIVNFSLPAQILLAFTKYFTRDELLNSGMHILVPFAACFSLYFLSRLFCVVFKVNKNRRGVYSVLFALSNSVFIGFPVAQALFGDAGMPYATFFYLGNTTCFWTLGYYGVKKDVQEITGTQQKLHVWEIIKKVFNVPIVFILISLLLVLFEIPLPSMVEKAADFMGGLTVPLSMIFIGCVLYDIGFKKLKIEKDLVGVLIGRFILSGLAMFGVCMLLGISGLARNVYITQITLPAMTQTIIVSELLGADSDFAAKGIAWTTLLSLITIPLIMLIASGG
jgi:predicted permease